MELFTYIEGYINFYFEVFSRSLHSLFLFSAAALPPPKIKNELRQML